MPQRPPPDRGARAAAAAVQYLKLLTGARVLAVAVSAGRLARALELGADDACAPEEADGDVLGRLVLVP